MCIYELYLRFIPPFMQHLRYTCIEVQVLFLYHISILLFLTFLVYFNWLEMPGTRTKVYLSFYCTTNNPWVPSQQGNIEGFLQRFFERFGGSWNTTCEVLSGIQIWGVTYTRNCLLNYALNFKIENIWI